MFSFFVLCFCLRRFQKKIEIFVYKKYASSNKSLSPSIDDGGAQDAYKLTLVQ